MDVECCNCGEPWDQYYLRHELTPEEVRDGSWRFGSSRLVVLSCPACKENEPLSDARDRKWAVQAIAEILGDDEDGLASTLEDFGLYTA